MSIARWILEKHASAKLSAPVKVAVATVVASLFLLLLPALSFAQPAGPGPGGETLENCVNNLRDCNILGMQWLDGSGPGSVDGKVLQVIFKYPTTNESSWEYASTFADPDRFLFSAAVAIIKDDGARADLVRVRGGSTEPLKNNLTIGGTAPDLSSSSPDGKTNLIVNVRIDIGEENAPDEERRLGGFKVTARLGGTDETTTFTPNPLAPNLPAGEWETTGTATGRVFPGNYEVCVARASDSASRICQDQGVRGSSDVSMTININEDDDVLRADIAAIEGDELPPTCESEGGPLAWMLCGVLETAIGGVQFLYETFIENRLSIEPLNTEGDLYQTWSGFRVVANALFVVAFLVIIFSQSLSVNLDAYTIKKIMPRLVAAAILVQFSFIFSGVLVDIFNILGEGVKGLITSPVRDGPLIVFDGGDGVVGLSSLIIGGVVGFASGATLFSVVPIVLSGFASLMIGVLTILARNVLISLLVVLSPIAAVAWILPNTDKTARLWGDVFIKLLVMYPLIQGLIGMGELAAGIVSDGSESNGFYQAITVFVLLLAPYFMLPFTFRFAGGAIARLSGVMNDKKRGIVDRSRQAAKQRSAQNRADMSAGARFKGNNMFSRGVNKATSTLGAGSAMFKGSGAVRAQVEANRQKAAAMRGEKDVFQAFQNNDKAMRMMGLGKKEADEMMRKIRMGVGPDGKTITDEEKAAWEQAYGAAQRVGWDRSNQQAALTQLTKSGRQFKAGKEGYVQLANAVADLTGVGSQNIDQDGRLVDPNHANAGAYVDMMNSMQYNLGQAGRYDLGGINNGTGYDPTSGFQKVSPVQILRSQPEALQAYVDYQRGILEQHAPNINFDQPNWGLQPEAYSQVSTAAVRLREIEGGKALTTEKNISKIEDGMATITPQVRSIMDQPEIVSSARDFGRANRYTNFDEGDAATVNGRTQPGQPRQQAAPATGTTGGDEQELTVDHGPSPQNEVSPGGVILPTRTQTSQSQSTSQPSNWQVWGEPIKLGSAVTLEDGSASNPNEFVVRMRDNQGNVQYIRASDAEKRNLL